MRQHRQAGASESGPKGGTERGRQEVFRNYACGQTQTGNNEGLAESHLV